MRSAQRFLRNQLDGWRHILLHAEDNWEQRCARPTISDNNVGTHAKLYSPHPFTKLKTVRFLSSHWKSPEFCNFEKGEGVQQ